MVWHVSCDDSSGRALPSILCMGALHTVAARLSILYPTITRSCLHHCKLNRKYIYETLRLLSLVRFPSSSNSLRRQSRGANTESTSATRLMSLTTTYSSHCMLGIALKAVFIMASHTALVRYLRTIVSMAT